MRTLALFVLMSGLALAAKPVFEVPEAGGYDRAWVTLGVTNDTDKPMKVEKGFCAGLGVSSLAGKDPVALKMTACEDLGAFTLAPGETVSKRFNLLTCFPDMGTPGKYSVSWAHPSIIAKEPLKAEIEIVAEYAEMEIEGYGTLFIRFYADKVPKTVENFKKLTLKGFYNSLTFHRVIRGFMAQGGCPRGDGTGDPGYKFDDEPSPILHKPGVLSMANSGPNTNGSQFFVMFGDAPWLDGKHTTFGKVFEGLDVVYKIERECRVPDQRTGRPVKPPVMKKVSWHAKETK